MKIIMMAIAAILTSGNVYAAEGEYKPLSSDAIIQELSKPVVTWIKGKSFSYQQIISDVRIRKALPRVIFTDHIINFKSGSDQVIGSAYRQLEEMGSAINQLLKNNQNERILLVGHTDAVGHFSYNMDLSRRRAFAIRRILNREYGVPLTSLKAAWYGEQFLTVPVQNGNRENRRVVLIRVTDFLVSVKEKIIVTQKTEVKIVAKKVTIQSPPVKMNAPLAAAKRKPLSSTGEGAYRSLGRD